MECWNDGMMGKKIFLQPHIPLFHYSNIPSLNPRFHHSITPVLIIPDPHRVIRAKEVHRYLIVP